VTAASVETLDRRDAEPRVVRATLRDLAVVNALFGGRQAAAWGVRRSLAPSNAGPVTLLDLGAGMGDVARHLAARLGPRWILRVVALDHLRTAARACRETGLPALVADFADLPLRGRPVDVVLLSQALHHVARARIPGLLRRVTACARIGVVVADLRRSRLARTGIWLAGHLLQFHPATRRDGVISVTRGFSAAELRDLCVAAGIRPAVARRPGWRVVAWWRTEGSCER
jgi:SAM-dependent methyltransferase